MILLGVIQAFSHSFKVPELGANFSAKEISTREPLNKNSPNLLDFESSRRGEKKRAPLLCRGQAGLQHGRSLRVCPANPHGLMLGNRRLLQKYQPVAPTQIQLPSSLARVPINSFSLGAPSKKEHMHQFCIQKSDCPPQNH